MLLTPRGGVKGHCRRRKIRCLLAKDDIHGRCSNCIRLKKECNFYPVESGDRRPRSMTKVDGGIGGRQGPGSSNSSPSPGHGGESSHFHLGVMEGSSRGYTSSLPVTPTAEYSSSFDDSFRKANIGQKRGRPPSSRSTDVSRRPSLAQMHVMPLAMKVETGLLRPLDGGLQGSNRWEASIPQPEAMPTVAMSAPEFTNPSSAFWRLGHDTNHLAYSPPLAPQPTSENFRSFISFENAPDISEASWTSQLPSRMGSVDNEIGAGYSLDGMYPPSPEYSQVPPELCSASTSTASLTTSLSEASSVYGGDNQQTSDGRYYLSQWTPQPTYPVEIPLKRDAFETTMETSVSMYSDDSRYPSFNDDATFTFRSANQSPLSSV